MSPILEVEYKEMSKWVYPIRVAIEAKPVLASRDARWSDGPLSDLAFTISTRLGCLPDVIRFVDENLDFLGQELDRKGAATIDRLIRDGYVYTFEDYRPVRRVLVGVDSFIAESRACFEHLADFYGEFMKNYFDKNTGNEAANYAAIASMASSPVWADNLKNLRHKVLHERSVWVAFEVRREKSPPYEPLLLLNWRPGPLEPKDQVKFQILRDIRDRLDEAATKLRERLIQEVEAAQ